MFAQSGWTRSRTGAARGNRASSATPASNRRSPGRHRANQGQRHGHNNGGHDAPTDAFAHPKHDRAAARSGVRPRPSRAWTSAPPSSNRSAVAHAPLLAASCSVQSSRSWACAVPTRASAANIPTVADSQFGALYRMYRNTPVTRPPVARRCPGSRQRLCMVVQAFANCSNGPRPGAHRRANAVWHGSTCRSTLREATRHPLPTSP